MTNISAATSQKIKNMSVVCAMLVVTIHVDWPSDSAMMSTWWVDRILKCGISRIAVPFFFVVSGYFLARHFNDKDWWRNESLKRVHSLVAPFVFWSLVSLCAFPLFMMPISIVADIVAHRPFGTSIHFPEVKDWMTLFGFDLTDYPSLGPLWYVRCLFFFVLVSPFVKFVLKQFPKIWLLGIYLVSFMGSHIFSGDIAKFFGPGFSLGGLFYFSVGCYLGLGNSYRISKRASLCISAFGLLLLALKIFLSYNHLRFEQSVGKLMIPFLLYGGWWLIPSKKWPVWLTRCSFPIFLMHMIVFPFLGLITMFPNHIPSLNDQLMAYWRCVGGIVVPIVIVACLKRMVPRFADFAFAGRS